MINNHFSREELLSIIETDYLQYGEASMLARIALAAMDSSESIELPLDYLKGHKDGLEWASQLAEANHPETGDWLYDDPIELAKAIRKGPDMPPAQPAPVVDADDNFYSWFGREWAENYQHNQYTAAAKQMLGVMAESAWKAGRRAAMLQAGDTVRDLSTPVDPQVAEYEQNVMQDGNSPVIPDGYVMVPVEPTAEMILSAMRDNETGEVAEIYELMLAAAPQEVKGES